MEVSEHCKFNLDGVGLRTGRQGVPVAINKVLSHTNHNCTHKMKTVTC